MLVWNWRIRPVSRLILMLGLLGSPGLEPGSDVYVVPAGGGEPQRLIWHPGADIALG